MKYFFSFILVLLFSCFKQLDAQIDYKGFPQWSWHQQDSTEYYLYTPSQNSQYGLYPIVLFLHGCCGQDYHATLRNTVDPPVRMWHNFGANTQSVPTYIIAPATKVGWKQHIQNLKKVIDDLVQHHHGDPQRIYITGFSMGGDGTWEFLQQYPNFFAAAIPMGMNFHGDHKKIKNIPIWTHRGETDYWANSLQKDVSQIRKLNGDNIDSNQNWVTGVNPRFTSYKGYGHVVQWVAASTNDLIGWAYAKRNDGNAYPVVFFKTPSYQQKIEKGRPVSVQIQAADPDGSIQKLVIRVNGRYHTTLTKQPYATNILPPPGDAQIEVTAYDNKGKTSTATTVVRTNVAASLLTPELPFGRRGAYYEKLLAARGNGIVVFSLADATSLPRGLQLTERGMVSGIPQAAGDSIKILVKDEDGDTASMQYRLAVKEKKPEEIVVSNVHNDSGVVFPVSKMRLGAVTHFDRGDDEVTVSDAAGYEGMTYIPGSNKDTSRSNSNYLSFDVDELAKVYVAYERKDHLFTSTIPAWLQQWKKVPAGQIVAQYFYYDVYEKTFPKGSITLPGADEKKNNVSNTYFVLVQKSLSPYQFAPEINTSNLADGFLYQPYKEQLTALYGSGLLNWRLSKGSLPKGVQLSADGTLYGTPESKGNFLFSVMVRDDKGNTAAKDFAITVK